MTRSARKDDQRRRLLAARRLHLGLSQSALGELIGVSTDTIGLWERGAYLPLPRYRPALAKALGATLPELDQLLGLEASPSVNGHRVPVWLSHYESLVEAAAWLGEVEPLTVPGLLQTTAYASAVEQANEVRKTEIELGERVELRLARQAALHREHEPLSLDVLLAGGVLQDPVGSADVMAEQLAHLLELAAQPNVDIRILGPGRAAAAIGGFELLARPGDHTPFMAVTLSVAGPHYHEDPYLVSKFVSRFNHLHTTALSPSESVHRIEQLRRSFLT
jgi:transcriptional regulator with XRE-family HTH domain